jgi:SAM-dependent methyltransferase
LTEVETPRKRDDTTSSHEDHWLGSRHIVQVRPHVWAWLAPRVGAGEVLEIGPGLRPTAPVGTSTFVDPSEHALEALAARGGTTARASTSLPFQDGSFDAVLAFEVIEHVEDDVTLLGEMARVAKPDAVLVLSTPIRASMWSPLDDACGHVRRDEPSTLFDKVRAAGFETGGYAWTPADSRRLARIRARALTSDRQLSTALVQRLVFPFHAAYQRTFGTLSWKAPSAPVPAEAGGVMLWALRSDDAAAPVDTD